MWWDSLIPALDDLLAFGIFELIKKLLHQMKVFVVDWCGVFLVMRMGFCT